MAAETIEQYIAESDPSVRDTLTRLRATIGEVAPGAEEKIRYGMPAIRLGSGWLHFAAWKKQA